MPPASSIHLTLRLHRKARPRHSLMFMGSSLGVPDAKRLPRPGTTRVKKRDARAYVYERASRGVPADPARV